MNYQKSILKIISEILIVLILGSLALFFLIKNIDQLADGIKDKEWLDNASKNRPDLIIKLKRDYQTITPYIEILKKALPQEGDLANLDREFNKISQNNQLNPTFTLLKKSTAINDNLKKTSFIITVNGNSKNLINYLKELETWPFFFEIKSVNILEQGSGSNLSLWGELYLRPTD